MALNREFEGRYALYTQESSLLASLKPVSNLIFVLLICAHADESVEAGNRQSSSIQWTCLNTVETLFTIPAILCLLIVTVYFGRQSDIYSARDQIAENWTAVTHC